MFRHSGDDPEIDMEMWMTGIDEMEKYFGLNWSDVELENHGLVFEHTSAKIRFSVGMTVRWPPGM